MTNFTINANYILPQLLLLSYLVIGSAHIWRYRPNFNISYIFLFFCLNVLILFVCSSFAKLDIIVAIFKFTIFGSIIYIIYDIYIHRYKCIYITYLRRSEIYVFSIMFFYFFYITRDVMHWQDDEFTHWARANKAVNLLDTLNRSGMDFVLPTYPPGSTLVQYLITRFLGDGEDNQIFAITCLIIASWTSILSAFPKESISRLVISFVVIFFTPFLFIYHVNPWTTSRVDYLLAAIFAAGLISFVGNKQTPTSLTFTSIILSLCILLKDSALVFILISSSIIMINWGRKIYTCFQSKQFGRIVEFAILLLMPFFLLIFWKFQIEIQGVSSRLAYASFDFQQRLARENFTVESIQIGRNFFLALFGGFYVDNNYVLKSITIMTTSSWFVKHIFSSFSVFIWLIVLNTYLFLVIGNICSEKRDIVLYSWVLLNIGFLFYSAILLFYYIFLFPISDGLRLVSFERYLGTYICAMFMFVIFLGTGKGTNFRKNVKSLVPLSILSVFVFALLPIEHARWEFFNGFRTPWYLQRIAPRVEIASSFQSGLDKIPFDKAVAVVNLGNDNYFARLVGFTLFPRKSFQFCGVNNQFESVLSCSNGTIIPISTVLEDFEYIILFGSEIGSQTYLSYRGKKLSKGVYQRREDRGVVSLVPI